MARRWGWGWILVLAAGCGTTSELDRGNCPAPGWGAVSLLDGQTSCAQFNAMGQRVVDQVHTHGWLGGSEDYRAWRVIVVGETDWKSVNTSGDVVGSTSSDERSITLSGQHLEILLHESLHARDAMRGLPDWATHDGWTARGYDAALRAFAGYTGHD